MCVRLTRSKRLSGGVEAQKNMESSSGRGKDQVGSLLGTWGGEGKDRGVQMVGIWKAKQQRLEPELALLFGDLATMKCCGNPVHLDPLLWVNW